MQTRIHAIREVLDAGRGVASRAALRGVASDRAIDGAVARGELVRLHPGTYVDPRLASLPVTRMTAASAYGGGGSALSHTTGLVLHGLLDEGHALPVHLTVPAATRRRTGAGLRVHRSAVLGRPDAPRGLQVHRRRGLPVLAVEGCLVLAYPLLAPDTRTSVAIAAVRDRVATTERIQAVVAATPGAPTADLLRTLRLVEAGCHSPLEIFGLLHVFADPMLPPSVRQHPVMAAGVRHRFDVAWPEVLLAAELDGLAFHGPDAIERDRRRDARLAMLGWQTLRFTGRRLHEDPDGVRREVLATYRARAQLMGA